MAVNHAGDFMVMVAFGNYDGGAIDNQGAEVMVVVAVDVTGVLKPGNYGLSPFT